MRLLFISVLFVQITAQANWVDGIFGKNTPAGPCRGKIEVENLPISKLWKEADRLKANNKFCESAAYYLRIMIDTLNGEEKSRAWVNRIESYFYKYDYEAFFYEVETFYQERGSTPQWQDIHFILTKAIFELASGHGGGVGSPWVQYALGIHTEQLVQDSPKQMYKLRSFLEAFPDSKDAPLVRDYLEQIKTIFNEDYLNETRIMVMKREYVPAIVRYQVILKQGPDYRDFAVAAYELVNLNYEFSWAILDEKIVPSARLARWLATTEENISSAKRQEVSGLLQDQAKKITQMMEQHLPNNPWTKRARRSH